MASLTAQAGLITLFETNQALTNIDQAEILINNNTPTLSFSQDIFNFQNSFPGGWRDTFALNAIGLLDTDIYNALTIRHVNRFRLRINGFVVVEFTGQTAPR